MGVDVRNYKMRQTGWGGVEDQRENISVFEYGLRNLVSVRIMRLSHLRDTIAIVEGQADADSLDFEDLAHVIMGKVGADVFLRRPTRRTCHVR